MYAIKKVNEERFLTRRGAKKPYTVRLSEARTFTTTEAADEDRCPGNEVVIDVSHYLR